MKASLPAAYGAKRATAKPCPECGKAMCKGGCAPKMADGGMVDMELPSSEMDSDREEDLPTEEKAISLAAEIMKDRRRMAKGGEVDAPLEDGREERGLDLEPAPTIEDEEHDTSNASLVEEILSTRRKARR